MYTPRVFTVGLSAMVLVTLYLGTIAYVAFIPCMYEALIFNRGDIPVGRGAGDNLLF